MEGVGVQRADSSINIDYIPREKPKERYDLRGRGEAEKTKKVWCCCLPFFRNRKVSEESLRK